MITLDIRIPYGISSGLIYIGTLGLCKKINLFIFYKTCLLRMSPRSKDILGSYKFLSFRSILVLVHIIYMIIH